MTKLHLIQKEFTLQYTTLTFYYIYCKGHIQTMSNDSIINVLTKYNKMNKMTKLYSLQLIIYITIYSTYPLLYCKGHIQIINNDNTKNVETINNRMNKMTKLHSLLLKFTLRYITLTDYYIVKDIHLNDKY